MEARINQFPKRGHNATKLGSAAPPESGFLTGYKITKKRTTTIQFANSIEDNSCFYLDGGEDAR